MCVCIIYTSCVDVLQAVGAGVCCMTKACIDMFTKCLAAGTYIQGCVWL